MKFSQSSPATKWRPKVAHGETVGFVVNTGQAPKRGGRNFCRSIFCRPIRGLNILSINNPTVSPWATFFRASGAAARQFAVAVIILFAALGATAQTMNALSDAEIQGRQLAQKILEQLEQQPAANSTNTGVLKIRDAKANHYNVPVRIETVVNVTSWQVSYIATFSEESSQDWKIRCKILKIEHSMWQPNRYEQTDWSEHGIKSNGVAVTIFELDANRKLVKQNSTISSATSALTENDQFTPFAGSDFWICDLGLEFFQWPTQKILKKEIRRSRGCTVLESTNPNPSTNSYSRVVSWIDGETLGIVHAEAYDANGKLLKEFDPKSFKKVNGQWELQEMEIRNVQTGSRTRLEFDLEKK
jgi:hypothetical protein